MLKKLTTLVLTLVFTLFTLVNAANAQEQESADIAALANGEPFAIMFDNANFSGQAVVVTSDILCFTDENFNDKLSSVIVQNGSFTLFSDCDFGNPSVTIDEKGGVNGGAYTSADWLGGRNDYYSSIRVNR